MYKQLVRPFFFLFSPEYTQRLALASLGFIGRIPGGRGFLKMLYSKKPQGLGTEVFGINFPSPVGLSAGYDRNGEYYNDLACLGFGFIEIGSITPKAQDGSPRPRIFRIPKDKALINRVGGASKGVKAVIENIKKERPNVIIGASLAKNSTSRTKKEIVSDYISSFSQIYDFVDYITVNISNPTSQSNKDINDISFLSEILDPLLELRLYYELYRPILVKLSPDIPTQQLETILDWCQYSGIDGVVATNTTKSREGLTLGQEKIDKLGDGGLSGAPLFNKSLALVKHINEYTKGRLPIVGVGGIMTPSQAKLMLDAGASLIQVHTGFIYEGPSFAKKIIKHLISSKH